MLKLAEFYERSCEAFVRDLARRDVHDPEVLAEVRKLAAKPERHEARVAALLARKRAELNPAQREALERAALLDILEVERTAREFYMRSFERVQDPEVGHLFRDLARAESRHLELAEHALALAEMRHGPPEPRGPKGALRSLEEETTPLWEGTSEPRPKDVPERT